MSGNIFLGGGLKVEGGRRLLLRLIVISLLLPPSTILLTSCGGGDDDGRRLGDMIVGTWWRGWGEDDVIIEGDTSLNPENLSYSRFVFEADGKYNGMVREGSFVSYGTDGDIIYQGTYKCDNSNLRLEYTDGGTRRTILARVLGFTDETIRLQYENDEYNVTVTLVLHHDEQFEPEYD